MPPWVLALLTMVISNPDLQAQGAEAAAGALKDFLPDVTEPSLVSFLRLVADAMETAIP